MTSECVTMVPGPRTSAETIEENHPRLSLAQAYASLAWYSDHQQEMDAEIERQGDRLEAVRAATPTSPLARRTRRRRP